MKTWGIKGERIEMLGRALWVQQTASARALQQPRVWSSQCCKGEQCKLGGWGEEVRTERKQEMDATGGV